jgi:hypothetical protein
MKNLLDVMKQKETEILQKETDLTQLRKELSALYVVLPLLAEPGDPKPVMVTLP